MRATKLNRLEAKNRRYLEHQHWKLFRKVRKKLTKIPNLAYKDKKILIADLKESNQDLLDVLSHAEPFKDVSDYFDTINAYLSLETESYDYNGILLAYMPGKMKELIQVITNQHNIIDSKDKLRKLVGLK